MDRAPGVIFGGPTLPDEAAADVAGLYDPATNRWTVTSKAPVGPLNAPTAVWTGQRMILAGITRGHPKLELAGYDSASDTWTRLNPPISPQHATLGLVMVATNDGVLLWSLWGRTRPTGPCFAGTCYGVDVLRRDPSGIWTNVTGHWPQGDTVDEPIFTGSAILVAPGQISCGLCSAPPPFDEHGYQVDPETLRITPLPHGPLDDLGPQIGWPAPPRSRSTPQARSPAPTPAFSPATSPSGNSAPAGGAARTSPLQIDDAPSVWSGDQLCVLAQDGRLLAHSG